jgi:molybdate transport system regulatory protein
MKKEIRVRCWIDLDGENSLAPAELLALIQESGSIAQAAETGRKIATAYQS